jgi:hypothetical protein
LEGVVFLAVTRLCRAEAFPAFFVGSSFWSLAGCL